VDYEEILKHAIKFEIDGKNQAIHEYDKMIWALRTGYLTVFFAVWGLLIKSMIDKGEIPQIDQIVTLMSLLAVVITVGACCVDANYVRRKYKVIKAMNKLYWTLIDSAQGDQKQFEKFKELIMISGTTAPSCIADASSNNLRGTGYWREVVICIVVYLIPLIVLLTGLILLTR
jgi:hypothetical protein